MPPTPPPVGYLWATTDEQLHPAVTLDALPLQLLDIGKQESVEAGQIRPPPVNPPPPRLEQPSRPTRAISMVLCF
jgi:hypothetical protein